MLEENAFHSCSVKSPTIYFSEVRPPNPSCDLTIDQGTCRDYVIRWYYDKQANACAQFWFGGCGGNENRYETEDECRETCVVARRGKLSNLVFSIISAYFSIYFYPDSYFIVFKLHLSFQWDERTSQVADKSSFLIFSSLMFYDLCSTTFSNSLQRLFTDTEEVLNFLIHVSFAALIKEN